MNTQRRHFLRTSTAGATALLLQPMLQRMRLEAAGVDRSAFAQRFVFVVKASGLIAPNQLEWPGRHIFPDSP